MSDRERMSPVDTTWLRMDNPANLMMIVAIWVLEGPVDLKRLENQLAEGLLSYRRYRQKVEDTGAAVYWVDDPRFDLAHHIKRLRLPGRGGIEAVSDLTRTASCAALAFAPADPLSAPCATRENHPSASSRACSASSFCIASAGLQRAASL